VNAPAERADTPSLFLLYPYIDSVYGTIKVCCKYNYGCMVPGNHRNRIVSFSMGKKPVFEYIYTVKEVNDFNDGIER
jgi:hypothetical protein